MDPRASAEIPRRSTSLTDQHATGETVSIPPDELDRPTALTPTSESAKIAKDHTHGHDSAAQPSVRTNRFSLTFPVLPSSKETSPKRQTRATSGHDTAATGSSEWLTAIAAQERRVLEIKEELHKAEAELNKLKLQWATHEAQKKKDEAKKTTKLRPLSTTLPSDANDGVAGSSSWLQHEMERRKILMSGARNSSRRIFSGSKHTRTLSLLSPLQTHLPEIPSQHRPRGATSPVKSESRGDEPATQLLPRAATTPDLSVGDGDVKLDLSGIDKDMLLKTGKRMAMDLKDGIWTFWEDLRQATVGEELIEVVPPTHLRQQGSNQTLRTPRRGGIKSRGSSRGSRASVDVKRTARSPLERRASSHQVSLPLSGESSFEECGASRAPPHTSTMSKHAKAPSVAVSAASSDAFDAWDDSPKASRSSSATSEGTSHLTPDSSKHTSPVTRSETATRDPIPWPNITKFGPATLRRTASHLMSEWDKLSPPLGEERKDYLETKGLELGKTKKQD
ncbi:hypothetical protein AMS68_007001 [Peltaster fructicola]|uniref:DUF4048 domain-containing protein n=1 Tax=Peltaster fructicola TaxID=286661 RepID=A0A6H0Y399_9PEZI|nr:hypothetical protein AMS68_007001 [Peltaster fructicola]